MATFTYRVTIDGTDVAGMTLSGGTITHGGTSVGEPPAPSTAYLTMISADAAGDLVATYPGISWRGGIPSGYVDTFADEYEGALSALKPGAPLVIKTATESGYVDTFEANYRAGFDSVRFTGYVSAIDYLPGTISITATDAIERLTRTPIDCHSWPVETEAERVARISSVSGISIALYGAGLVNVTATPADEKPATPWTLLTTLADSTGGLVYVTRDGQLVYRAIEDLLDVTTILPADTTLLDGFQMTIELGRVKNRYTVEYGAKPSGGERPSITVEDQSSIAEYGIRDGGTIRSMLEDQADATTLGNRLLAAYALPRWHLPSVTAFLKFARNDGDIAQLLSVDLDDVLELPALLPASPEASYASRIIGYTETLAPEAWQMTYVLDPHGWSREGITV